MEAVKNMKEKFNNLSTVAKGVILVLLFVILGGACYGGYNYKKHGSIMGEPKAVEEDVEAPETDKKGGKSDKGKDNGLKSKTLPRTKAEEVKEVEKAEGAKDARKAKDAKKAEKTKEVKKAEVIEEVEEIE